MHRAFLKEHECDEIQGYLISRPVAAPECEKFLRASAQRAVVTQTGK